jgi:hypothetical protein
MLVQLSKIAVGVGAILGGVFDGFKAAITPVLRGMGSIGEKMLNFLNALSSSEPMSRELYNTLKNVGEVIGQVAGLLSMLGIVIVGIAKVGPILTSVLGVFSAISSAVGAVITKIQLLVALVKASGLGSLLSFIASKLGGTLAVAAGGLAVGGASFIGSQQPESPQTPSVDQALRPQNTVTATDPALLELFSRQTNLLEQIAETNTALMTEEQRSNTQRALESQIRSR